MEIALQGILPLLQGCKNRAKQKPQYFKPTYQLIIRPNMAEVPFILY
jgi:hypothetical protein